MSGASVKPITRKFVFDSTTHELKAVDVPSRPKRLVGVSPRSLRFALWVLALAVSAIGFDLAAGAKGDASATRVAPSGVQR